MADQFVTVITDEAMGRIAYDGGWMLTPYQFYVSETDPFEGWEEGDIFNDDGSVTEAAYEYLKELTTAYMQTDYSNGNCWFNSKFSSITRASDTSLTHHLTIPGDTIIPGNSGLNSKVIQTIYFMYQDRYGQEFMYAIARANARLTFEEGITQSFFFNFTVTNAQNQDLTDFILNYSCAHEIEDHNTTYGENIHSDLVARDGSREITGILSYDGQRTFTSDYQLITKQYVDDYIQQVVSDILQQEAVPPGFCTYWPGSSAPTGWLVRDGSTYNISTYPKLYAVLGTTYGGNGSTTFAVPNDLAVYIRGRGSQTVSSISYSGGNVGALDADTVYFKSSSGWFHGCRGNAESGLYADGTVFTFGSANHTDTGRRNPTTPNHIHHISMDLSVNTRIGAETKPVTRTYLPIIKHDYI